MSVLVCFALKEEAGPFRKILGAHPGTAVIITGIGRENAGRSIQEFLQTGSPDWVLTCGFAGGLNPTLKIGDVVFATPDDSTILPERDAGLPGKLKGAGAIPAKFFCADRIATTAGEKKRLRDETGADAVEMESDAIHEVCRTRRIPCTTLRVISDTAGENLPLDFNALAKADRSLDFGKLGWAVARSPGKIPSLLALQKKTRFAAEQLAMVLAKIIAP